MCSVDLQEPFAVDPQRPGESRVGFLDQGDLDMAFSLPCPHATLTLDPTSNESNSGPTILRRVFSTNLQIPVSDRSKSLMQPDPCRFEKEAKKSMACPHESAGSPLQRVGRLLVRLGLEGVFRGIPDGSRCTFWSLTCHHLCSFPPVNHLSSEDACKIP
ncbi:hypothetical protein BDZ85DRAFT_86957 [Elsinoe ampelina]|uniref:Uncharacterized protein n=1 Tax=Elsinoe ampelina TaxID=302913 RepID=A0A6A6GH93_9PEZI|nr:hypothetical protein BDZ85DRAFT_86957 [Elsinoe ampelina]